MGPGDTDPRILEMREREQRRGTRTDDACMQCEGPLDDDAIMGVCAECAAEETADDQMVANRVVAQDHPIEENPEDPFAPPPFMEYDRKSPWLEDEPWGDPPDDKTLPTVQVGTSRRSRFRRPGSGGDSGRELRLAGEAGG